MQPHKSQNSAFTRKISPYESTQLAKYGHSITELLTAGEMPVEYLTHHVTFCTHDFYVSPTVLIPRVETEELVAMAVQECLRVAQLSTSKKRPLKLLDLGTGSGAIGISIAAELTHLRLSYRLTLSDISSAALEVAQKNAQTHLVDSDSITFTESDLFSELAPAQFDLILANLPYIPSAKMPQLDRCVQDFEPWGALDGGVDGLQLIQKCIAQAGLFIHHHSVILLELDESHTLAQLERIAPDFRVKLKKDSFEKIRFARLERK